MPGDTHNFGPTVPALFAAHEQRYQEAQETINRLTRELAEARAVIDEWSQPVPQSEWQKKCAEVERLSAENERLRKALMRIYYFQPDVVFQLETAAEQMRRFAKDALDKRLDAALAAGGK